MNLTPEEKQAIRSNVQSFLQELDSERGRAFQAERKSRVQFFQEEIKRRLPEFSVADFETVVSMLWASEMWGNKAYLAQKLINDNGLETLRRQIEMLATTPDPEEAYARCLAEVKGMGPASVTEILTYMHPNRCGIWNRQARDALRLLGITDKLNLNKYALSADEYRTFNRLLKAITRELQASGVPDADLLMVDYFLYFLAQSGDKRPANGDDDERDFDHNEIRDVVAEIGNIMGFDTSTEERIAYGAVVDVVWRTKIANLGLVSYVFEVHRSGSIDSLILNLQKALRGPSVQKVIAVSDTKQLEKIKQECEGLQEEFRRRLRYWPVREVLATVQHLRSAMESINELGLIEDEG